MSIYQVQYKKDSHTYVSDIEADSKDDVLVLFNDLVVAEVLEIRKYVYKNIKYPLDNGDYQKGVSFTLINDKLQFHKISLKKIVYSHHYLKLLQYERSITIKRLPSY